MIPSIEHFPVAIIEDRYTGAYSGGLWLAISNANCVVEDGGSRVKFCLDDGPFADDIIAHSFWLEPPDWIAVGKTPSEALENLYARKPKEEA